MLTRSVIHAVCSGLDDVILGHDVGESPVGAITNGHETKAEIARSCQLLGQLTPAVSR